MKTLCLCLVTTEARLSSAANSGHSGNMKWTIGIIVQLSSNDLAEDIVQEEQ